MCIRDRAIAVQAVECEEAVGGGVDVEPPVAGAAYAERSGHEPVSYTHLFMSFTTC